MYTCATQGSKVVKWKDSRKSWLKLTLRSSFLNLKLFKIMSRLSASPPRNLTLCCPFKNLHMIRLVWAILEKEVRFVSAKNDEKIKEVKLEIETPATVKRTIGAKPGEKGKSLPKKQRGPQVKHVCHYCGIQGHTMPNCFKLHALKKANSMHGQEISKRRPKGAQSKGVSEGHLIGDIMEMLKNISLCLASFISRFKSNVSCTPPSKALT